MTLYYVGGFRVPVFEIWPVKVLTHLMVNQQTYIQI